MRGGGRKGEERINVEWQLMTFTTDKLGSTKLNSLSRQIREVFFFYINSAPKKYLAVKVVAVVVTVVEAVFFIVVLLPTALPICIDWACWSAPYR